MSDADASTTPISGQRAAASSSGEERFPRTFGQYLLLENFARGGMGEVYLAKLGGIAGLEKYCVLKKLRQELTRDREYVTRFIDEARVVVTLNHANICHVFDVGRVGEEYYLAMEYISGRDLRVLQDRARAQGKQLPPQTVLHVVCEILEALDYAHRRKHPLTGEALNLVHRDVSPQNVLVSYEGEVKLIDFGLAASRLKVERTQPNIVMGKMAYMAPEQARGDGIDARADLFAVGVVCYELLSGERFYEGMSANDIWQVAGRGSYVPPRWRELDSELAKILGKALHADFNKRYATCGDFREALASHLHWRYPGTGVRSLREVMCEVFADELAHERDMLARFGKVSISTFKASIESTKSHSVAKSEAEPGPIRPVKVGLAVLAPEATPATGTGAGAGTTALGVPREVSVAAQSTRTALDSGSGGSTMPPPRRDATVVAAVGRVDETELASDPKRDLANQPTMLEAALPKRGATTSSDDAVHDERTMLARDERISKPARATAATSTPADAKPVAERTEIVARARNRDSTMLVREVETSTPPRPAAKPRGVQLAGALVGVVALFAVGAFVTKDLWLPAQTATSTPVSAAPTASTRKLVVVDAAPAAVPPAASDPTAIVPTAIEPTAVEPVAVEPVAVEAAAAEPDEVAKTRPKVVKRPEKKPAAVAEKPTPAPVPVPAPAPPPAASGPTSWKQLTDPATLVKAVGGCSKPCKGLVLKDWPAYKDMTPERKNQFKKALWECREQCGLAPPK